MDRAAALAAVSAREVNARRQAAMVESIAGGGGVRTGGITWLRPCCHSAWLARSDQPAIAAGGFGGPRPFDLSVARTEVWLAATACEDVNMDKQGQAYRQLRLRDGRKVYARAVQASDADLLVAYFDAVSQENRDFMHGFRFNRENAEAITADPDDNAWRRVVVVDRAEPGERIVGYSWITPTRETPERKPFLGIGLVDEFTNAGLGQALLRLMIRDAGQVLGLARLWLGVWADNPRAIRAYEAVGFRQDPEMPPKDFDGRKELYMVVAPGSCQTPSGKVVNRSLST